jgi:phytoene synthase
MMRPLLGATDRRAIPYAVDLGVAMQLTNIARDVLEDARRGRRYLPISDGSVTPQALLAGETLARERAWQEIQGVLELAHSYYRSADRGMVFIPLRSRIAIATAARIYESIGARILQLGPEAYWGERARVGALGKIQGTIRGLAHAMSMARPDRHDQALYQPFGDLLNEDAGTEWMN